MLALEAYGDKVTKIWHFEDPWKKEGIGDFNIKNEDFFFRSLMQTFI